MKKGCFTSIYIFLVLLVVLVVAFIWIIKSAFGPSHKTVKIDLGSGKTLIGKEIYNADFAQVFYEVDFKLVAQSLDTFNLGGATFHDENWHTNLNLDTVGNWLILPVKESSYSKLLLVNRADKKNQDTVFSPLDLRYDSLWRAKHDEIPVYLYTGTSTIDSIRMNNIFVNYDYRIGYSEPFTIYVQSVEYGLDPITGEVKTKNVFERKVK